MLAKNNNGGFNFKSNQIEEKRQIVSFPAQIYKTFFNKIYSAMGITGLAKLIADIAPWAIKETEIKNYFGRKVAIDASKKTTKNLNILKC